MSTEPYGSGRRGFVLPFIVVVVALAIVGLGTAAATAWQGPRVTDVSVDPSAAVAASGSRLIVSTTQSLREVAPDQVTVTPDVPFTVDTSGRSLGVRFATPLWDDTEYTVRIDGVEGLGGGAAVTVEEAFTTPPLEVFVLERSPDGDDAIVRVGLDGRSGEAVARAERIEDFRATADGLVVVTDDGAGASRLLRVSPDGQEVVELPLPGVGTVRSLHTADRGGVVGYTFSSLDPLAPDAIDSVLYIASVTDAAVGDAPVPVEITGVDDARVDDWRFVPGTDTLLVLTFDGLLSLVSTAGDDAVALGNALSIEGIAPGTVDAIVQRLEDVAVVDLADGVVDALVAAPAVIGQVGDIVPLPDGGTVRVAAELDGFTIAGTTAYAVDAAGDARAVFEVPATSAMVQVCASPSGRYAAFTVAPDIVENPYDGYQLPLPETLRTHVVQLVDGAEVTVLDGAGVSWCREGPRL